MVFVSTRNLDPNVLRLAQHLRISPLLLPTDPPTADPTFTSHGNLETSCPCCPCSANPPLPRLSPPTTAPTTQTTTDSPVRRWLPGRDRAALAASSWVSPLHGRAPPDGARHPCLNATRRLRFLHHRASPPPPTLAPQRCVPRVFYNHPHAILRQIFPAAATSALHAATPHPRPRRPRVASLRLRLPSHHRPRRAATPTTAAHRHTLTPRWRWPTTLSSSSLMPPTGPSVGLLTTPALGEPPDAVETGGVSGNGSVPAGERQWQR